MLACLMHAKVSKHTAIRYCRLRLTDVNSGVLNAFFCLWHFDKVQLVINAQLGRRSLNSAAFTFINIHFARCF